MEATALLFTHGPGHAWASRGPEHACTHARTLEPRVLRGLERVLAATVSPQEAALTFDVVILSRRHQSWLSAHWCGSDSRWPSAPRTGREKKNGHNQNAPIGLVRARASFGRDGGNFSGRLNQSSNTYIITSRSLKSKNRRCFSHNRGHGIRLLLRLPVSAGAAVNSGCAAPALNNSATGSWVMKKRRGLNRIL